MKKAVFLIVYTILGILYLYNLPRLLAWLLYKSVLVYGLLSIAGYILLFFALYRILKKYFTAMSIAAFKIYIFGTIFLFFIYILPMSLAWKHYDWRLYIDNGADENVEFTVNNEPYSVYANSFNDSYYPTIHCPVLSIDYKGQNYRFDRPSKLVFNIDALNDYYIIKHDVRYSFGDASFTLTDSITDTVQNEMFFTLPHSIDKWFEYPERIYIRITKDKNEKETKRDKPKQIYSIQRISEYKEYKKMNTKIVPQG